jgi:DNA repair protein RAD5
MGAAASSSSASSSAASSGGPMTCEALMKAVEQVWPVEAPSPPGLVVGALKPYQKQSLAFMLRLERAADGAETVGMGNMRDEDGFSLQQVRGGWLADEVGMGKTVVTIALILANPLSLAKSAAVAIAADGGGGAASVKKQQTKKTKLSNVWKTTVVICPNTIVGQWYDELRKYAPSLNTKIWHSDFPVKRGGCVRTPAELKKVDVLVTTPGCLLSICFERNRVWRVIVDGALLHCSPCPRARVCELN